MTAGTWHPVWKHLPEKGRNEPSSLLYETRSGWGGMVPASRSAVGRVHLSFAESGPGPWERKAHQPKRQGDARGFHFDYGRPLAGHQGRACSSCRDDANRCDLRRQLRYLSTLLGRPSNPARGTSGDHDTLASTFPPPPLEAATDSALSSRVCGPWPNQTLEHTTNNRGNGHADPFVVT